jgi:hypothetical protein
MNWFQAFAFTNAACAACTLVPLIAFFQSKPVGDAEMLGRGGKGSLWTVQVGLALFTTLFCRQTPADESQYVPCTVCSM